MQHFTPIITDARGGRIFCPSHFLSVTILKNPYKTKTNKARMLIFSVKVTYHGRRLQHSTPIITGARGGEFFVRHYFCPSRF